jgi:cold shock CspA family protein
MDTAPERDPALDIRKRELRGNGQQRTGTVRWWKSEKGYGRITADDGEILFVHFSGVIGDGYRELTEGDRVTFVTGTGMVDYDRSVAEDVRVDR